MVKKSYQYADVEVEQEYDVNYGPRQYYTFTIRQGDKSWTISTWMMTIWHHKFPDYEDRRAAQGLLEALYKAYSTPDLYDDDTEAHAYIALRKREQKGFLAFRKDLKAIAADIGPRLKPAMDAVMQEIARIRRSKQHRAEKGPREWFPRSDEPPF